MNESGGDNNKRGHATEASDSLQAKKKPKPTLDTQAVDTITTSRKCLLCENTKCPGNLSRQCANCKNTKCCTSGFSKTQWKEGDTATVCIDCEACPRYSFKLREAKKLAEKKAQRKARSRKKRKASRREIFCQKPTKFYACRVCRQMQDRKGYATDQKIAYGMLAKNEKEDMDRDMGNGPICLQCILKLPRPCKDCKETKPLDQFPEGQWQRNPLWGKLTIETYYSQPFSRCLSCDVVKAKEDEEQHKAEEAKANEECPAEFKDPIMKQEPKAACEHPIMRKHNAQFCDLDCYCHLCEPHLVDPGSVVATCESNGGNNGSNGNDNNNGNQNNSDGSRHKPPKENEPHTRTRNGVEESWCDICTFWRKGEHRHLTAGHRTREKIAEDKAKEEREAKLKALIMKQEPIAACEHPIMRKHNVQFYEVPKLDFRQTCPNLVNPRSVVGTYDIIYHHGEWSGGQDESRTTKGTCRFWLTTDEEIGAANNERSLEAVTHARDDENISGRMEFDKELRLTHNACFQKDYTLGSCDGFVFQTILENEECDATGNRYMGYELSKSFLFRIHRRVACPWMKYEFSEHNREEGDSVKFETLEEAEALMENYEKGDPKHWLARHTCLVPEVIPPIRQFLIQQRKPVLFLEPGDLVLNTTWGDTRLRCDTSCILRRRKEESTQSCHNHSSVASESRCVVTMLASESRSLRR
ncbi:expressed unknown protein [Seminavis robusta]|uniref:Uncharacterized protein n=1 Tax=Seminavis robusta TaxID=568900 RepID=A0A9N8HPM6_9STRA|nr:expressed unknown protein [Seminavis robusta]|eukprot:Sro913_g219470.1 n/a (698) ;mRNA; r:25734-27827